MRTEIMNKKALIIFGTRPEAIKMSPLIKALQQQSNFTTKVCITAQHREMLDQVLDFFEIEADFDLNLMKPNQNLYNLTATIIKELKPVLEDFKPDYVFVHGDTTTTMAASIASFYAGAQICHVEAGLRTHNKRNPFPEELNRSLTGRIADFHFAPTTTAKNNLLKENIAVETIQITGNTVIDALLFSVEKLKHTSFKINEIQGLKKILDLDKKLILVTGHRRENHGQGFENICLALKTIAKNNPEVQIVYPVHLNPKVKKPVHENLEGLKNVFLIEPLSYPSFVWLMNQSYIILTDSGGVQEEAPSLGKPVLVMRNTTERPEAVEAGTVILVGTDTKKIINETQKLLEDTNHYNVMAKTHNPYGDGKACGKIIDFLNDQ
jgi:UDP-N-acetylglucosamine 2-epimerase (non-hydrolysing)